jgi:hypothetical protein
VVVVSGHEEGFLRPGVTDRFFLRSSRLAAGQAAPIPQAYQAYQA